VAGTLACQSHLGALPPVVTTAAVAVALRSFSGSRSAPRAGGRRRALLTIGLLVLLWAPPVLEQATAAEGNVTRLIRFFRDSGTESAVGWELGLRIAGTQLAPWGPWLGRERPAFFGALVPSPLWHFAVACIPLMVAGGLAVRSRDGLGVRLVTATAMAVVAIVVANAQTRGPAFYYLTEWSRAVAMMIVAAPVVVLARRSARLSQALAARARFFSTLAMAVVSLGAGAGALRAEVPSPFPSRAHYAIVPYAVAAVPSGAVVRVIAGGPPFSVSPEAVAVAFERAGRIARLPTSYAPHLGEHRTVSEEADLPTLQLLSGIDAEPRSPETRRLLYRYDPLPSGDRTEATALRAKLEDALRAGHRDDLLPFLRGSNAWLPVLGVPPTVDARELKRYLALTAGEDKIQWALFALPHASW
jgi:hypothetical protein